ncbi:EAL domain-containing protein [Sulfidibacter corallicola]|uniref:EAL domain-containing protein n=1 Tax=Sulfidibacter corallicola TaxID=2818388 RepID=A0A8A4TUN0_SULCO|nr:EAL domain-containing protein [Sulfidibacter corallicola]QTD52821.1 EAL domain-containing protein [Sulfidibacter corallicola]
MNQLLKKHALKLILLVLLLIFAPVAEPLVTRLWTSGRTEHLQAQVTRQAQWQERVIQIEELAARLQRRFSQAIRERDQAALDEAVDLARVLDAECHALLQIEPSDALRELRIQAHQVAETQQELFLRLRDSETDATAAEIRDNHARLNQVLEAWDQAFHDYRRERIEAFHDELADIGAYSMRLESFVVAFMLRCIVGLLLLGYLLMLFSRRREGRLQRDNRRLEDDLESRNVALHQANEALKNEIEERNAAEWEVRKRLHMEETLGKASGMLTLPTAPKFESFLELLAEVMAVDRAFIVLFKHESMVIEKVFEWPTRPTAAGESGTAGLEGEDLMTYPWWYERVRTNEPLAIEDVAALPFSAEKERALFEANHIHAMLSLPVHTVDDETLGFMCFVDPEKPRSWQSASIRMLFLVSELLANYFARQKAEEQLRHDAFYDRLTDLPNRLLFKNRLEHAIQKCKRHHEYNFSVLFLDLDRFKSVNDTLGHLVGDQLLIELSDRLKDSVRPGDTVARLSGDEFVILLESIIEVEEVIRVVQRIENHIQKPFMLKGKEIHISASIGITQGNTEYKSAEAVIRDADIAMYRAKTLGKARYSVFDKHMHDKAVSAMEIEHNLRRALEQDEFELHFQPILSARTGEVSGAEALIRWNKPGYGTVSPSDFIPIAEETGLILPIGEWALRAACRHVRGWLDAGREPLTVSVNCSARQLQRQDLPGIAAALLEEAELDASLIKVELTESAVMGDVDHAISVLNRLHAMNIKISVDDFGTGYSSLAYLKRFPINTLKIDRSFINGILENDDDRAIISSIIAMAHSLNLSIVAEGVENEEQLALLRDLGCDEIQGYFYSKPLPADRFMAFVDARARSLREAGDEALEAGGEPAGSSN